MKQSPYFSHDSNARMDEKTLEMRGKFGLDGYGLYWCIIEMLSEATDYKLSLSRLDGIAIAVPCDCHKLREFIDCCIKPPIELFETDEVSFWSQSLLDRMALKEEKRKRKSFAGKKGANSRWHNDSSVITDPMAKHGKVKESKVKESKVKESKVKESKVKESKVKVKEEEKKQYLDFVYLTADQFSKVTEKEIENINNYAHQIGIKAFKKYVSHYHTIVNWRKKNGSTISKTDNAKDSKFTGLNEKDYHKGTF